MIYSFKNTKTGKIVDISMKMSEYAPYKGENGDEDHWERIYYTPQVNMSNSKANPWDGKSFAEKTSKMKGTYGDLLDYSKELSLKRAEKSDTGEDPVKRKTFDNYEKQTGKKHFHDKKTKIEKNGISVEL